MAWVNADGLEVKFGADWRSKVVNASRTVDTDGLTKEFELDFDLTRIPTGTVSYTTDLDNDGTVDGFTKADVLIPAYSHVISADVIMTVAAAGGTSIKVGRFQEAGTAIDDDGLVTATEGVLANMNAQGKFVNGLGADVTLTSGAGISTGQYDSFIGVTATGTFTAGKGKIVLRYRTSTT